MNTQYQQYNERRKEREAKNQEYLERYKARRAAALYDDYYQKWQNEAKSFSGFANSASNGKYTSAADASKLYASANDSFNRMKEIESHLVGLTDYYKKWWNKDEADRARSINTHVNNANNSVWQANSKLSNWAESWKKFKDEDDYNAQKAAIERHNRLMNMDTEAEAKAIEEAESKIDRGKIAYANRNNTAMGVTVSPEAAEQLKKATLGSETYEKTNDLSSRKKDLVEARRLQDAARLEKEAKTAADLTSSLAQYENKTERLNEINREINALTTGNGGHSQQNRDRLAQLYAERQALDFAALSPENVVSDLALNREEANTYRYLVGSGKTEDARLYLDAIADRIAARQAQETFAGMEGNNFAEVVNAFQAGADQAFSFTRLLRGKDAYNNYRSTESDYLTSYIKQDLEERGAWLGNFLYDAIQTTTAQLPYIALSSAVGSGVGGVAGEAVGAKAGEIASSAAMGFNAGSQTYINAINSGYTEDGALTYATLNGIMESGLQYLLGGISKAGGVLTKPAAEKVSTGFAKALGKITEKYANSKLWNGVKNAFSFIAGKATQAGGEFVEEALQEVLDPIIKQIATGEEQEPAKIEDALYAGLLGFVSAVALNTVTDTVGEVQTYRLGKKAANSQNTDFIIDRLTELANAENADVSRLADAARAGKSAYTIGKLIREVAGDISEQNRADIEKSLVRKGLSQEDAATASEWLAAVVNNGTSLTRKQAKIVQSQSPEAEAYKNVVRNTQSTVGQRNAAFQSLINDFANPDTVETRSYAAQAALANMREDNKFAKQSPKLGISANDTTVYEESPVKLVGVSKLTSGGKAEVELQTESGNTIKVDSGKVRFSRDDALVVEAAAALGMGTTAATQFIQNREGTNALFYVMSYAEAYRAGRLGLGEDYIARLGRSLSPTQRNTAMRMGQLDGKYNDSAIEKDQAGHIKATVKNAVEIGKRLGRNVKVLPASERHGDRSNGYINMTTGEIVIYEDAKDPVGFVLKHELTHFLETGGIKYADFANKVMESTAFKDWVNVEGFANLTEMKQNYKERWGLTDTLNKDGTVKVSWETKANQEILADFVGTVLFGGKNNISEKLLLAMEPKQRRTFGQMVRDFFNWILSKFRKDSSMYKEISKLENAFIHTYMQVQTEFLNKSERSNVEEIKQNISKTKTMSWSEQMDEYFSTKPSSRMKRNDTPVLQIQIPYVEEAVDGIGTVVPGSIITKAMSGKDFSHSATKSDIRALDRIIGNSYAVVYEKSRNSVVFLSIRRGATMAVAIKLNTTFDGDSVNRSTSIHFKPTPWSYISNLSDGDVVYIKNKNEFETAMDGAIQSRTPKSDVKFVYKDNSTVSEESQEENKKSMPSDREYLDLAKDPKKNEAQLNQMVEQAAATGGWSIRGYHGTSRSDRVGNVFDPERATSGPMAFFTSDPQIAQNYATGKRDTSIAYDPDFDRYETQFRIKTKYRDMPLHKAWGFLSFAERKAITEKASQLREDWDNDGGLILDPETNEANGGFQWQLKESGGNAISALEEQWLNSGTLFNEENRFLDVLKMAGVTEAFRKIGMDSLYFKDPNARFEKVYNVFLRFDRPFNTSLADEKFADGLQKWYERQDQSKYDQESASADMWDKRDIDANVFAERLREDLKNKTTHAWTVIPDSVTDYLKSLGYDSIIDKGGKYTADEHIVYIPFYSWQIKSADPVTYDDNGNVIPLSERFNQEKDNIRYSMARGDKPLPTVAPATRNQSFTIPIDSDANVARIVQEVSQVLDGSMSSGMMVLLGVPSGALSRFINATKPLYMTQKAIKKAVLPKSEKGGKHGLGRVVIDQLAYQLADPMAITGNTEEHIAKGDNSVVVWTDWATENGDSIIVPITIDAKGSVGVFNSVNTTFDAYNPDYVRNLLRAGNVKYTRNNKSIDELLAQRRHMPKWQSNDTSDVTVPQNDGVVKQKISSAKTSIKQIPALFRDKNVKFGETNVDIGGGRFDLATNYLAQNGTTNYIFDPFNRTEAENARALDVVRNGGADTATCANVLNVIAEKDARANVILEAAKAIKDGGTAYFMVYEGDGSGNGKETSAGWQNNRKTADYVPEISEYFDTVTRQGKLIIAQDPIANLPQAYWELSPGNGVRYSMPTEESIRSHLEDFENHKITREQLVALLAGEEATLTPSQIVSQAREAATTTPVIDRAHRVGRGDTESNLYQSLMGADIFDDRVKALTADNDYIKTYASVSNEATMKQAQKLLDEGGAKFVQEWMARDAKKTDPTDVAVGMILMYRYQETGKVDDAVKVAEKLRSMGTKAGQTVQMFSLIDKMDPNVMQAYLQSELDKAWADYVKGKTGKWIEENKLRYKLTQGEIDFIRNRTLQAAMLPEGRDKAILLGEIAAMIRDKMPTQAGQSLKAWQRITLLLNAKTQIRNIAGNAVMVPAFITSDFFGTIVDKALAKKTGVRTQGFNWRMEGIGGAIKKGMYESIDDMRRGINTKEDMLNRYALEHSGKSFNEHHVGKLANQLNGAAKALNALDRFTTFLLDFGDRPFYEAWFVNSINKQMRANHRTKEDGPTADMIAIAQKEALQRTWQDDNKFTLSVAALKRTMNNVHLPEAWADGRLSGYGLGDVLIKFTKTPANLAKAIFDFSPAGLVKALTADAVNFRKALASGEDVAQAQKRLTDSIGKALTGTVMTVLAALAASSLSGDGDKDKDVAAFERYIQGMPSYSIKIGDKWFSYEWSQPVGAILATVADIMHNKKEDTPALETFQDVLTVGGDILMQQSFLKSVAELFGKDEIMDSFFAAIVNDLVPNVPTLMGQLANATDPYRRKTYSNSFVENMWNQVKSKVPGLRQTLPVDVDVMGRDIPNTQHNVFNAFINPANTYANTSTPVTDELYRLYQSTGNAGMIPSKAPNVVKIQGTSRSLNTEEQRKYQQVYGKTVSDALEGVVNSAAYKALSDDERAEVVKSVYSYAEAKAKASFVYAYPTVKALTQGTVSEAAYNRMSDGEKKRYTHQYILASYDKYDGMSAAQIAESLVSDAAEESSAQPYQSKTVNNALALGNTDAAKSMIEANIQYKVDNHDASKDKKKLSAQEIRQKAENSVKSSVTNYWKKRYQQAVKNGNSTEAARIRQMLFDTGLYGTKRDVTNTCSDWVKDLAK